MAKIGGGNFVMIMMPLQGTLIRESCRPCVATNLTRCYIAERPLCRVRYSFCRKQKTGTGTQYFTIYLSTTVIYWASKSVEFIEKTQNKGY